VEEILHTQIFVPKPKGYFALYYNATNPLNNENSIILMTKFFDPEIYSLIQTFSKKFSDFRSKIYVLELDIEELNEYKSNFSLPTFLEQRNSQALKNAEDDMEKSNIITTIITKEISKIQSKIEAFKNEITEPELLKYWTTQFNLIQRNLVMTNSKDFNTIYQCALFKYESLSQTYLTKVKKDRIAKNEKKLKFKELKAKKELESSAPAVITKELFEKTLKELDKLKIQMAKKAKEPSKQTKTRSKKVLKSDQTKNKDNRSENSKQKKGGHSKKQM